MRTATLLCVALLLLTVIAMTSPGLLEVQPRRLGSFVFHAPKPPELAPEDSQEFSVRLLSEEPFWLVASSPILVGKHRGQIQRISSIAPVAGSNPHPDIRDNHWTLWFPDLGEGLDVSWRSYGGVRLWLYDQHLKRAARKVVDSLEIVE